MELEKKIAGDVFRGRWGWVDMAMGIHEATGKNFFEVMSLKALEVFTIATYLIDKVDYIKNGNTGAN